LSDDSTEPRSEEIPERYAELFAGFGESEEGISAVATVVATGGAADLASDNLAADVVFRSIGVQWDLGMIQHAQEFSLVGVQPGKQAIKGGKTGLSFENAVEAGFECCFAPEIGSKAICLEIGVKPPDQGADPFLGPPRRIGKGVELMNEPFGMNPAERVFPDIELPGIVGQDDRAVEEAVGHDGSPQRAFGGDADRVGMNL